MEADFSGYATKSGLLCSDGRTILEGAFKHQDKAKVPLVWQHSYGEPANVLGHAMLEDRPDGMYCYGYFNDSTSGQNAKELVKHGDIDSLSIHANRLQQTQSRGVSHGMIREVSLVLTGANPGARIDTVNLRHADGEMETLDDEAIINTGLTFEHSIAEDDDAEEAPPVEAIQPDPSEVPEPILEEAPMPDLAHTDGEETIGDVFNTLTDKQKNVVYFLIGTLQEQEGALTQFDEDGNFIQHSDQEVYIMPRNVFDQTQQGNAQGGPSLSHAQLETIISDAQNGNGSLKDSFLSHAVEYGIENIDYLFPDAKTIEASPRFLSRRTEWVADVLAEATHSPIARVKSVVADITADEARAKGYVKGNLKKDEVIKLLKRVTTPTTVYKKQKLDRDDIVDITDLDVVAWLKAEMRLMLDAEIAVAILVGDGREADDEDKINEDHLRPIATDHDMYAHKVNIPSDASPAAIEEIILRSRTNYKGSGTPTFYTQDGILTDLLLQKDKMGRRVYDTEAALASALRVKRIVPVEALSQNPDILGIIVNLVDYRIGADKGGALSFFDDFDIDYNQYKYLLETRISGALTVPKSALVLVKPVGTLVTNVPQPSFDSATDTITFPEVEGVTYTVDGVAQTGTLVITETTDVEASPKVGYSFAPNTIVSWVYNV